MYLPNETGGSILVGKVRQGVSVVDQSQLCRHLHNHALPATPSWEKVVITRGAILSQHYSRNYAFKYKCFDGVPETSDDVMDSGMYVSDTRAMVRVHSRAKKKMGSGKSSSACCRGGNGGGGCGKSGGGGCGGGNASRGGWG